MQFEFDVFKMQIMFVEKKICQSMNIRGDLIIFNCSNDIRILKTDIYRYICEYMVGIR